jgi:hypothetical protein
VRREELRLQQDAGDEAVDRQDDRPADPVAERRDRADQGQVLPPGLVRVQRDAAGLVREHARELRVDVVLQCAQADRDRPEQEGAGRAESADRAAERRDEERRVRKRDHEAVPPRHGLEELSLLDLGCSHCFSSSFPLAAGERGIQ